MLYWTWERQGRKTGKSHKLIFRFLSLVIKYMVVPFTEMKNVGMGKTRKEKAYGIKSETLFWP